jgi:rod shape-determining protein MreD
VRVLWIALVVAVAVALQTMLARFAGGGTEAVDLVLVVVVYASLAGGPVTGILSGSGAGIVQDALSGGVVGIGGLAKAIVCFVCGVVARQFVITATVLRFAMFFAATAAHAAMFMGLYSLLDLRSYSSPWAMVSMQGVGNAVVGVVAFAVVEGVPGWAARRRIRKRARM